MFAAIRRSRTFGPAVFALFAFAFLPVWGYAQRLPDVARPQHYDLTLTPHLDSATFSGRETIDVVLEKPMNSITLNAAEIKFEQVTAEIHGQVQTAAVSLDAQREEATFHFGQTLPAGPVTLKVRYSGILNNELRGFYLSKTAKRNYAVTQFEATDARRAFPCFDEPSYKATFDVKLIVSTGDTAISNTNAVSDTPGPETGEHTIRFARTPKMSTYLVAFLVGDFQCLSGESDGVPIRACATPDKVQYGRFALSVAEFCLHYYDNYFGIKYPMPKLDMIALPDFEAGAMENFGAITYRETAMLVDPKAASVSAEKVVGVDVAHEMAHQWFGDMVTMNWWDNVWLNEGFATWMSSKPLAVWKPEWKIPEDVAAQLNGTLDLDAQKVTRTIRAKADTPDQINEMFDGITYGKAGAVLLMVENYLGEELFRQGVHRYLEQHMYGNATSEDFWNAQTEVSGKPVDKIMESLVTQPGEPIIAFSAVHGGQVQASQKRFFLNPKAAAKGQQTWTLPVCIKDGGGAPACPIMSETSQTLKVPAAPVFYANAEGKGYYRALYDGRVYRELLAGIETNLDPPERISLLGNEWALARAEKAEIGDFLNLAAAVRDDRSADVMATVAGTLAAIDQQLASNQDEHKMLAAWVRKTFAPALQRIGSPGPAASPEERQLRAILFGLLGGVGDDPGVIAQAKQVAEKYLENPASVDATLGATALEIAAQHGDTAFFEQVQHVSETAENPQLRVQALYALASFRDPVLARRALAYAVSGKVRNQSSSFVIVREFGSRATRDLAWDFVRGDWPQVQAQLTTMRGGAIVGATGNFCTAGRRAEVVAFFAEHPVPASARAFQGAKDSIDDCMELRATQGPKLDQWLAAEAR